MNRVTPAQERSERVAAHWARGRRGAVASQERSEMGDRIREPVEHSCHVVLDFLAAPPCHVEAWTRMEGWRLVSG